LFFDFNGNGKQDAEEPAVAGTLVELRNNVGVVIAQALSDSSGHYRLEDARTGSYSIHVRADLFSDKKFRYMCRSAEEVTQIAKGYNVILSEPSSQMNIGLIEGFLTLPFRKGTKFSRSSPFGMTGMFDVDRRLGFARSYDPLHVKSSSESGGMPPWVVDQAYHVDCCSTLALQDAIRIVQR